ncbi:MAG: DJ-1/PfpI family protein [Chloracidobacterium sp.]|nr:DJ-1/PfpI family protein [Chloracidobacterium sp.]MDW8216083.1 DJ-1/PfpI family protein [Acidobacteriota bacterium]
MPSQTSELSRIIVVYLYPGLTALDAIGPYEILRGLPGAVVHFVAQQRGPITVDSGFLRLQADVCCEEITQADILLVPGGNAPAQMNNLEALDWLRRIHATTRWTLSVCTGSLILAAAGILTGGEAATHWSARETLLQFGVAPSRARVTRQGKLITAAGVSAGIDAALMLAALECDQATAELMQLFVEYAPAPPFTAGTPETADPSIVARARAWLQQRASG